MCKNYIRIPRSLLRNPLWLDLPPAYQHVFMVLLDHVCFKPTKFDDHGHLIELEPGQICISERDLLKLCGSYISRNDIQRSIKKFILYDFVSQEVRHKKSILTIKHSETYEMILEASEPRSEPNLSQTRAKLEPQTNNVKKENNETNVVCAEKNGIVGNVLNDQKIVKDDIYFNNEKMKKGWSPEEIEYGWDAFEKCKTPITSPLKYIEGAISKQRAMKKSNKGKICPISPITENYSKPQSKTNNAPFLANGTSESPLAVFARQNGLK